MKPAAAHGPAPGRTRVLVTHDAGHALAEGDLVLGLRRGRPHLLTAGGQVLQSNIDALYA